jgi:hypothetical protein
VQAHGILTAEQRSALAAKLAERASCDGFGRR